MANVATAVPWLDVETMIKAGTGVRETARKLGLSEERVKRQATRKGWAAKAPAAQLETATAAYHEARAIAVPTVPTAADALAESLADDSRASRMSLSRGLRRVARHVETLDPAEALEQAQNVKATVGSLSAVHGWEAKAPAAQVLISVQMLGVRPAEAQVEGRVIEAE